MKKEREGGRKGERKRRKEGREERKEGRLGPNFPFQL